MPPLIPLPHPARSLPECFDHLTLPEFFDGACILEPRAYDFPDYTRYCLGRLAYIQHEPIDVAREYGQAGIRGWLIERLEAMSAVEALKDATSRNR